MSTHSSSEDSHSCIGSDFTSPSSVFSHGDDEERFNGLQAELRGFVQGLLKDKASKELVLGAYEERCRTLEGELLRLAELVRSLELEKSRGVTQQTLPSPPSPNASTESTICKWDGKAWAPVHAAAPAPMRHYIDPNKSMSKQDPPPCNNFYIVGNCDVPRCKFSHLYDLTPQQLEEMRRGARFHLCNALKNGVECEDASCCYGHVCPRGRACGRSNCAFNDEQHRLPSSSEPLAGRTSRPRSRR